MGKNDTHMQQDLLWFIFKVIPAIQKRWKPFSMDHFEEYYDCVTASDEAFALFTIMCYTSLPLNWKKRKHHATIEDDTESGVPEEIDTSHSKDQASDSGKKKSYRKDKLSGEKLTVAMEKYDGWFRRIVALRAHIKPHDSYLKQVIANHCNKEQEKKAKKASSASRPRQNCTELATTYLE